MASSQQDDLAQETTEGYKAGTKLTLDEYQNLDKGDEALNRWKASLGLGQGTPLAVAPDDKRNCVITSLALESPGRSPIVLDLTKPNALEDMKKHPFAIKEGARYHMKVQFRVQHAVLSGLKYVQVVKRKGIKVDKHQQMVGSYAPNTTDQPVYTKAFDEDEAPSGMLARGSYAAICNFVDDDNVSHLQFEWSFDIKKDW